MAEENKNVPLVSTEAAENDSSAQSLITAIASKNYFDKSGARCFPSSSSATRRIS